MYCCLVNIVNNDVVDFTSEDFASFLVDLKRQPDINVVEVIQGPLEYPTQMGVDLFIHSICKLLDAGAQFNPVILKVIAAHGTLIS